MKGTNYATTYLSTRARFQSWTWTIVRSSEGLLQPAVLELERKTTVFFRKQGWATSQTWMMAGRMPPFLNTDCRTVPTFTCETLFASHKWTLTGSHRYVTVCTKGSISRPIWVGRRFARKTWCRQMVQNNATYNYNMKCRLWSQVKSTTSRDSHIFFEFLWFPWKSTGENFWPARGLEVTTDVDVGFTASGALLCLLASILLLGPTDGQWKSLENSKWHITSTASRVVKHSLANHQEPLIACRCFQNGSSTRHIHKLDHNMNVNGYKCLMPVSSGIESMCSDM